jgi:hypothetical protein
MLLEQYHKYLKTLSISISDTDIEHLCKTYRDLSNKINKSHGRKTMIDRMKDLNSIAERYSIHQPIKPLHFCKSDKDCFPDQIKAFKPYLRSENPKVVRMVLSIFRSVEIFRLPPSHNIETVERLPQYDEKVVKEIIDFIPTFVSNLKLKISPKDMYYHYTVKNGPNGPALASSDTDLCAIRLDPELYSAIKTVSSELGDKSFPSEEYIPKNSTGIHSKLSQFSEKSGKTRTIAVVDYYSQRALRPLHDSLMNLLRNIPSDGTYSHNNVGNYVKRATSNKLDIVTSDMTAFTDLFPSIIQQKLLDNLTENRNLAQAWWTLLSKRSFKLAWADKHVYYGTGQPMGAYASWPLCTLAHHLIVHYSAHKTAQKAISKQYMIIGDDNANTNKVVASHYKETLQQLGCELNPYKGTSSIAGAKYSGAEVAKRLYLNGKDLSPLTPGLVNSLFNPYFVNTTLKELILTFDETEALPALLVNSIMSISNERDKKKIQVFVTNPYDGILKPGKPGYEDFNHPWSDFISDRENLYDTIFNIRNNNLMERSQIVGADPKGLSGLWVRLQSEPQLTPNDLEGIAECEAIIQYAHIQCAKHLRQQYYNALSEVMLQANMYDPDSISEDEIKLTEIEYLPDPTCPFIDRKDLRKTQTSSLIMSCYHALLDEQQ